MKFIAAVHGIHTKLTRPSWPWWFQAHAVKSKISAVIQTEHYWAFAWPSWNNLILNPRYGKSLARRLKLLVDEVPGTPVQFVAHSNGTNITVEAVKNLAEAGIKVDTIILIGSAVDADIEKSGLLKLFEDKMVDKIFAYVSDADEVIRPLRWHPGKYGTLGVDGFRFKGDRFGVWLVTDETPAAGERGFFVREFRDMSHSGYFDGLTLLSTLKLVCKDLHLQRMV
jgi:pimeloyl-ACP methyl ester carboxylesterase